MQKEEILICDCSHCRNIKKQQKQLELHFKKKTIKVSLEPFLLEASLPSGLFLLLVIV